MKKHCLAAGLLGCLVFAATGCSKKEDLAVKPLAPPPTTVQVVPANERSQHYLAVSKQLELGGTLYGYADVDGDALKLAGLLGDLAEKIAAADPKAAPYLKQDYAKLVTSLGATDIKAAGFSSVPDGTGFFRNRVFFHTPAGRHGLLAGLGGAPSAFVRVGLAPADTDVYFESEMDLPAVYSTVRELFVQVSGEKAAESFKAQLRRKSEDAAFSAYTFIQGLKGRAAMVMRLDATKTTRLPGPAGAAITIPAPSLLICLDGIASVVEADLVKATEFEATQEGNVRYFELKQSLPVEGIRPVFAIEGNALYFASSMSYLKECLQAAPNGLAHNDAFKQALAQVGAEGNGLAYINPKFFDQLRRIQSLNPALPAETKQAFDFVARMLPKTDRPLVTVRRNLPDGILISSYWNRSLKQDIAMLAVYNPATIGLMAAMAIPAFQKVRTSSQEKAVLNNLRQLSAAADQHYLENGVSTATYADLVGPDKYIRAITPVAGENYRAITFKANTPLQIMVPALRKVVRYAP
jgi:type IV pilus assembly protein PilA